MMRISTWCLVLALLTPACKSEDNSGADAGPQVGAPYSTCAVDSDCAWGEIDHEVAGPKDCVCLYGCPYIPLSKQTVERRAAQHAQRCNPQKDGSGQPCGIDDCALPPALSCQAGVCRAASSESH
jgi:hypothetical protein